MNLDDLASPGSIGDARGFHTLPAERLTRLEGWAMLAESMGYHYRPSTVDGVRQVLCTARGSGRSLIPRGAGYSYGDTSLNAENIVLDLSRMKRILGWNPATGIIRVEPGVTIGQLWRYVLEDGWWPAVVPGTMFPTLGGCVSTNVHGKNHWHAGSFGDHVLSMELMLPSGEIVPCGAAEHGDLFRATIGGLGLLGIVVSLTLQLQPVASGLLRVDELPAANLAAMFALFDQCLDRADYLIGWIDAFAHGSALGRGLVQIANPVEDDLRPLETLRTPFQDVPDLLFGVLPRSLLWRGMKLAANGPGMRILNSARFALGAMRPAKTSLVPHAQFHFMLDYVPHLKWAYRPGGIIQYQVFVPKSTAPSVFGVVLEESQRVGQIPHLAVFKRHRPDRFLLSYSVDGYSLALDYHATAQTEGALRRLLGRLTDEVVLPAGGRFYPAKDDSLDRQQMTHSLTAPAVEEFVALKRRIDPTEMLQSDLYRRALRREER